MRGEPPKIRRLLTVLFSSMVLVGVLATQAWAPAPRGSIQQGGLVLKKLDISGPPSYVNEFFAPPPAPGEKGGRDRLTDDVAAALHVMSDPASTQVDYCPPINDILNQATITNAYFDISQPVNPALDDFLKDWQKVKQLSGC